MKRGKVCEVHQEFSPDGECRWCEPPPSEVPATYLGMTIPPMAYPVAGLWRPLPIQNCKHDGVLLDYCGTTSCAACGKVLSVVTAPTP